VSDPPRIPPGGPREIGRLNYAIARAIGAATGGPPQHVFTTLGRHRGLFRRWLRYGAGLMPGGRLPREETELVILRVAHNCGSDYEWHHHERIGRTSGLGEEEIARVREGPDAEGWSDRRAAILRAADELHGPDRRISDGTWEQLSAHLKDVELIELCLLVGHYEGLAMTLNSLGVQPDPEPMRPPTWLAQRIQQRSRRKT
jgi:alkylhydroperoxidase family enzyme